MVPVIYLLNSSIVSLLSIACITWYAWLVGYEDYFSNGQSYPYLYGLFLLLIVPHYYYRFDRYNRHSNFFHLHNWLLVLSLCLVLGTFAARQSEMAWIFAGNMSLFGVLYLIGSSTYFKDYKLFANPAFVIGLPGILTILMIWSFEDIWRSFEPSNARYNFPFPFTFITIVLLIAGIALMIHKTRHSIQKFDPVAYAVYVFCLLVFLFLDKKAFAAMMVNGCILVIANFYIRKGSLQNHLGILNFGLLIMAVLALLRFFDESIPFIWRGIFFVATGAGFFVANYLLLKKRKTLIQNNNA